MATCFPSTAPKQFGNCQRRVKSPAILVQSALVGTWNKLETRNKLVGWTDLFLAKYVCEVQCEKMTFTFLLCMLFGHGSTAWWTKFCIRWKLPIMLKAWCHFCCRVVHGQRSAFYHPIFHFDNTKLRVLHFENQSNEIDIVQQAFKAHRDILYLLIAIALGTVNNENFFI